MIWLAVVFALASAATTAVSTSTQHLATGRAPKDSGLLGLMRFLLRQPLWLLALALGPIGFTCHVLALHHGPLALVQPIAIMGIVFAVPIRAALARSLPLRSEMVAVGVTALALAVFLLTSDAQAPERAPDLMVLFAGSTACAVAAAVAVIGSQTLPHPTGRAFLLGCASGVLFGLMAVLIEACQLSYDERGALHLATSWLPYALVAAGLGGISVNQLAYRQARLSASMPVLNVVNVLVTLCFAFAVLGEVPRHDVRAVVTAVVCLAAMAWGLWRLARIEESGPEPLLSEHDRRPPPHTSSTSSPAVPSDRGRAASGC